MDDYMSSSKLYEYCRLIEYLILDIKHLETEVVRNRYQLSQYLPPPHGELLRCDILSDLGGRYGGDPAYDSYVALFHDGHDPMDTDEWVHHIIQATKGN